MNLGYLSEFIEYSKCLNMTKAAQRLFMSVSTLSEHISSLEKELGVDLVRRGKQLRLTAAGITLAEGGERLVQDCDDLAAKVQRVHEAGGELSIAYETTATAPYRALTRCISMFMQDNPEMYLWVSTDVRQSAQDTIRECQVDCVGAFVSPIDSDREAGLSFVKIPSSERFRYAVWVHKSHPLASRERVGWADLNGLKHPVPARQYRMHAAAIRQLLEDHGVEMGFTNCSRDAAAFYPFLAEDEVQFLDEYAARGENFLLQGERVFVPVDEQDAFAEAYIAYDPQQVNPALRALIDYIESLDR